MSKSSEKRMATRFQFLCKQCKSEMTPGEDGYYCENCGNFVKYLKDKYNKRDNI